MGDSQRAIENRKEACKTYIEQTKLLVTLSSAFLIPPAAIRTFVRFVNIPTFVLTEVSFVFSIITGYVVMGTIAGSQDIGEYDVYRLATRLLSFLQILFYLAGLVLFIVMIAKLER